MLSLLPSAAGLSAGVMFSDFPSTCSGIAVLTRARLQQSSIWFFLQVLVPCCSGMCVGMP